MWKFVLAVTLALASTGSNHGVAAKDTTAVEASGGKVYFNTKSLKFHDPNCIWAKRCTRNCILVDRSEAEERGGVPCKVCGG